MPDICISKEGIEKMLQNIKRDKAAGPGSLPATVLQELSHEIAPILEFIYCRSIESGIVPSDWKTVSIFKKGDTHKAGEYRLVSLTCILGKCTENIIVSSISTHLDTNTILNPLKHGYCHYSTTSKTDMIVMEFTKFLIRCHTGDSYTSLSGNRMGSGVGLFTGSSAS